MSSLNKSGDASQTFKFEEDLAEDAKTKEEEEARRKLLSQPIFLYCTYLSACYYDKAREIADKERDCCKSNSAQFSNHLLFSVLSQLTAAEKQYMSLTYLAPKRFLMKDTSLSNQYTHLYNEISRVEDRTPNSRESSPDNEAVVLSAQIKNFIKARIALVDFFERLSAMGVKAILASQLAAAPLPISVAAVANSNKEVEGTTLPLDTNIVPSIEEIHSIYSTSLTHSLLGPLNMSFTFELNGLKSLLVALQEINRWRFYEALISLDQGRTCLAGWSDLMSTSIRGFDNILSTTSKMTFFSSFKSSLRSSSIRAADQVEPILHEWMSKLRAALHSKFSLYFYEVLLAQTTLADMKEKCAKLQNDYPSRILTFQRRMEATAISLVFDASPDQDTYKGPGYHHPDKRLAVPLQGLDLYPAPFTCPILGTGGTCIPQDEVARHWPCVVKIINDYARELDLPDKIVYIFDQRLENTYYLMRIDPRMTMVIIFERTKMEKDPQISGFLLEIAGLLRCTKLFAALKPGYK